MVVTGTYNPYLVTLSILVASFASYTALDLGGHVGAARGLARQAWLVAAAITMGGGIWSMHFIGMLAFVMPIPMSYDVGLTIFSLVVAIVVTGGGFYVISRQGPSPLSVVLSGIFMGLGIVAMHYIGMAAMRGHDELGYDGLFVALSVVIAIGASMAALWLAFQTTDLKQKLIAALVMGLAISGMHYTGMRAAIFTAHGSVHEAPVNASLDQTNLALAVAGITFVILAFASIASLSEQKRAEEALRQAQADLARVNRVTTMGALTASIAHEVNQPIAAAATNADACMRWLSRDPPNLEEARAAAMRIAKDVTRAVEIINRIRLLFKKGATQRELLDVNDVIREMIVLLRGEVAQHSVSVRTELAADLPPVIGDRVQLQQVMMNLMSNGIDAMKDVEGPRELGIKSQRAENAHLMVSVSDTGVGLPSQQTDQIFNAFVSTKLHGTGMGLSISRSVVESHISLLYREFLHKLMDCICCSRTCWRTLTDSQTAEIKRFIGRDYDVVLGMLERRLDDRTRGDSRVRSEVARHLTTAEWSVYMAKRVAKRARWTKPLLTELRRHSKARTPIAKIAKQMKRTEGALRQQALKLGIGLGHQR